jgi:AraC-like DNA-binding protein
MRRRRWKTARSAFTWLKRPSLARPGCCFVTSAAKDIGEALALFARYARIVNEALRVKLVRAPEGVVAEIAFVGLSRHSAKQATEFGVALIFKALREMSGRNIHPTHVSFIHGRNSDLRSFERFFRRPVEFGASGDRFSLSHETLALPLVTEDRHLLETLQPVCDEAARQRSTAIGTLRAAVENEAQKLLPHGKAKREIVARTLGLSERTLTRKLAEEGTTYEQVVDRLRAKSRAAIHQGARHIVFAGCLAARLRGVDLLQSCFQAVDGRPAVRRSKRETPSCSCMRTVGG